MTANHAFVLLGRKTYSHNTFNKIKQSSKNKSPNITKFSYTLFIIVNSVLKYMQSFILLYITNKLFPATIWCGYFPAHYNLTDKWKPGSCHYALLYAMSVTVSQFSGAPQLPCFTTQGRASSELKSEPVALQALFSSFPTRERKRLCT